MRFAVDRRLVLCLAVSSAIAAAAAPHPAAAEEIVVTSWGANLNSVPYAVGMEKGFFKDAGVEITSVMTTSGGGTAVRNVLASAIPYGEVSLDAAISAIRSGLPVVIVNAACRTVSEAAWVVKNDSKIDGIKQLPGKRIAYTRPKSVSEMLLVLSLGSASIDLNSVKRIAAGGYREGLTLLDNGAVDVAPVIEPMRSAVADKYKEIFGAVEYLKPMITTVGITTREFAAKNPEKIKAIVDGYRRSVEYTYAHPDEAAEIMAKHSTMKADLLKRSMSHVISAKFWSDGALDPVEMNNMVQGLHSVGMMDDAGIEWGKMIDQSFLPASLRQKL